MHLSAFDLLGHLCPEKKPQANLTLIVMPLYFYHMDQHRQMPALLISITKISQLLG